MLSGLAKLLDHGAGWRVSENIFIGDTVIIGDGTIVPLNSPVGRMMLGCPVVKMEITDAVFKRLRRLKGEFDDLAGLEKNLTNLPHKG